MRRFQGRLKWVVAAIVVAALAWAGTKALRARNGTSEEGTYTQVFTVQRGTLVTSISPTGQVAAQDRVALSFDVNKIPLTELHVTTGQQVKKGDVLARIDPASLERAVQQAEADLLSAEESLAKAQDPYTALDRQKAELDLAQAEAALAEARLATVDQEVQDATRALQQAKDKLAALQNDPSAQEQMDRLQYQANVAEVEHGKLLEGPITSEEGRDRLRLAYNKMMDARDTLESAQARAALDRLNASNNVTEAEQALAKLQAGPNALGVLQVGNKIAQAEYNLAKAKDSLATISAGPDAKTVQLAQARYEAAKAALEKAQATLDSATMVAPFDGTVLSVGADIGDLVSSNSSMVTLADLSGLEILANVDETDIHNVEVGQEASITFDALSGQKFTGKVLEVPLEGTLSNNVVSYRVRVSLDNAQAASLRSGMTANVTIVVARRANALLVPVLAVQSSDDGDVVMLQDPVQGTTVTTRVQIGLNDGTYVEVLRGLNEGDQIVVQYSSTTTQQQTGFPGAGVMIEMGGGPGRVISGESPAQPPSR